MPSSFSIRASRDGDQFHYLWAARRCLRLLSAAEGLAAIAIEGPSANEGSKTETVAGEEVIDVAEYYGSQDITRATRVCYIQLKYSTSQSTVAWTPSGLRKTIVAFAKRYRGLREQFGGKDLYGRFEFCFVSNRPVDSKVHETVGDAASGTTPRHPEILKKLKRFVGLTGPALSDFYRTFRIEDGQDGYWDQRNILVQDLSGYLPDADADAPVQLKELVTQRALSQSTANPTVTKNDVLRALKTDESQLFPAQSLIASVQNLVPREQEPELIEEIVRAENRPVIIHADGGVGKSIFATRIHIGLPEHSLCVVYDCFGNGQYRSPSGYRHRHKTGLVQIANELAAAGTCHPLIPSPHADSSAYLKAFLRRLGQCAGLLRAASAAALVCVVVDAADNAQMAAEEISESRSFPRDLLRESIPEGVRLVALCRTHRVSLLDPPPNAVQRELRPFSRAETEANLLAYFPSATARDVDEFHGLSSHNPRVQAAALSRQVSLQEVLAKLGPSPTTIDAVFAARIANIRDASGTSGKDQTDRICTALAVLRPLIPIAVVASMTGAPESAIRSFALDLGRGLLISGASLQFLDEPTETWFQQNFRPNVANLAQFIEALKPLAASSAYVAAVLPQLLLEADRLDDLVTLALHSQALPDASPIERRDVELQRLQFALKASLRAQRRVDAAKLALKAGGESAGNERQAALLQSNTDLAGRLLDTDRIQEVVSRRTFGSAWPGSHYAYEAGLLSGREELIGEARSHLRMAEEWVHTLSRLSEGERQQERVTVGDIAEMALAHLNIHGPLACATYLRGWKPRSVSFDGGRIVSERLVDAGRYSDLDTLAAAGGSDLRLVLAVANEARRVNHNLPPETVKWALGALADPRIKLEEAERFGHDEKLLAAVTALVESGYCLSLADTGVLGHILSRYLPSSPPASLTSNFPYGASRFRLLRAYALKAALVKEPLTFIDLAHPALRKELERNANSESRDARALRTDIDLLLRWQTLWARAFLGQIAGDELLPAITAAESASGAAVEKDPREGLHTVNEIAEIWLDIVLTAGSSAAALMERLDSWITSLARPLYTATITGLARKAARTKGIEQYAFRYVETAFSVEQDHRDDAGSKVRTFVGLARAIFALSKEEAAAYFDSAVNVAGRIGDENLARWTAMLDLAERAADPARPAPEAAYNLSRCAELTREYVDRDKHFDWGRTVRAIAGLCPASSWAILSRWRDRAFGSESRLLPKVTYLLVERGDLDAVTALTLIGFRAEWDLVRLVKNALAVLSEQADKERAFALALPYALLEPRSKETWRGLKALLDAHGLSSSEVDAQIAFDQARASAPVERLDQQKVSDSLQGDADGQKWDAVFADVNLGTAEGVAMAYRRFLDAGAPLYREVFFAQANKRVDTGREAQYIEAVSNVNAFDLFDFEGFFKKFPNEWRNRLAAKKELISLANLVCRRFCMKIGRHRYYELFPFDLVSELTGLSAAQLADTVLAAVAATPESASTDRLFSLIGLLAANLSHGGALEALSFGFSLFDNVLKSEDGDGPWSPNLAPASTVEGAVAGYVWAGLANPDADLRWEAAHVVRACCTLERVEALEHLVAMATVGTGGPYVDARLYFYKLHAMQWMLIAIARAAIDSPTVLVPHVTFLLNASLNGPPHVLLRGFAARALSALFTSHALEPNDELERRLAEVNVSPFPQVTSTRRERLRSADKDDTDGDHFYFDIDMDSYWFSPLGDCFGISAKEVERLAKGVIKGDWHYPGENSWREDERQRRKIYGYDDFYRDSRSDPRVHDLRFYLSYHAIMVVAGKLLSSLPTHHDPEGMHGCFAHWLSDHGLVRQDGKWVADRRDPAPLESPDWKRASDTTDWQWSISREDFEKLLFGADQSINVSGHWTYALNDREESITIQSALVGPEASSALLRALQTDEPFRAWLPPSGDDAEIDSGTFVLKGWIASRREASGLDVRDPWAGNISYPPVSPAPCVIDLMDLAADPERRIWTIREQARPALRSTLWGQFKERRDEEEGESGCRLQASYEFVQSLLRNLRMDLIAKVQIHRRHRQTRYGGRQSNDFGYIEPSARFFLVKGDGRIATL